MARSSLRLSSAAAEDGNDREKVSTPVLQDDADADADTTKPSKSGTGTTAKKGPQKRSKATTNQSKDSTSTSTNKKSKTTTISQNEEEEEDEEMANVLKEEDHAAPPQKKAAKKKRMTQKKATAHDSDENKDESTGGDDEDPKVPKTKKTAAPPVQSITERDALPQLWTPPAGSNSYTLKIVTWNVAGLRGLLKKDESVLGDFVTRHQIDILCLQETKLQESHVDDPKLKLRGHLLEPEGYDAYYSCSTAKKGYAGTAVFVKRRGDNHNNHQKTKKQTDITSFFGSNNNNNKTQTKKESTDTTSTKLPVDSKLLVPSQVSYGLGIDKHDREGRVIVLDFPGFTMANLYVPNAGQKLERLHYRTEEWDKDLLAFMQTKRQERGVPVLWLGDLNVAHKNWEAYNFGAKHLDKQAGLTPQERASFTAQLDAGFVDAFRHLHPEAKGHYTYWSQRAGNREPNKGLRLDYFVCDPALLNQDATVVVRDSYMIPEQMGSDHCPAVLELEIKAQDET